MLLEVKANFQSLMILFIVLLLKGKFGNGSGTDSRRRGGRRGGGVVSQVSRFKQAKRHHLAISFPEYFQLHNIGTYYSVLLPNFTPSILGKGGGCCFKQANKLLALHIVL